MTSRIHFIFPRFHTNFIDLVDQLSLERQIYWHVLFKHKNDDFLNNYNISFIGIQNNFNPSLKVGPIKLFRTLKKINNYDTLVYRPIGNSTPILYFINLLLVLLYSKIRKINLLLYNQIDYERFISIDKKFELISYLSLILKFKIITPISSEVTDTANSKNIFSLIPFYLNTLKFAEVKKDSQKKKIVFVGKLFEKRKRFDIFKNIVEWYSHNPNIEFIILGIDKGESDNIKDDLLYKKFIAIGVSIFINISREDVYEIYKNCDYLVYPSEFEQAGVSPLEAMASKVIPIVFSGMNKMNLSSNYIKTFYNGFKVDVNHYSEYVRVIDLLIKYPELEEDIKNNCYLYVSRISKLSLNAWRDNIF